MGNNQVDTLNNGSKLALEAVTFEGFWLGPEDRRGIVYLEKNGNKFYLWVSRESYDNLRENSVTGTPINEGDIHLKIQIGDGKESIRMKQPELFSQFQNEKFYVQLSAKRTENDVFFVEVSILKSLVSPS